MIILAIETCFNRCAACLYDSAAGMVLAGEQQEMERGQAEALAPMVQRLLEKAAIGIESVARVAVTTGPGTFTGLRIGLSFARALGLARNIPVVGLDSLRAVALSVEKSDGPVTIAHKAGQSGFHYVLRDLKSTTLEIIKSEDLQALLKSWKGLLLGTGADELAGQVKNSLLKRDVARDLPDLRRLAAFAADVVPPTSMPEPIYLREADAKPQVAAQLPLRVAGPDDIPTLAAHHQQSFAKGWNEADLTGMLSVAGTQALVIESQGHLAGFIMLRAILCEAEILTLAVVPALRQRGLGKTLLQAALASAHTNGISSIFLEVNANNAAAIALYKACGFAETGRRKGYYTTPQGIEDAILMAKRIP
jgi:tRNA threonylcarbamoyladenosine biosynthesis protein TsaB